jgi:site-specific DNA-methyltransferase (adenine-specific)/modification methylase
MVLARRKAVVQVVSRDPLEVTIGPHHRLLLADCLAVRDYLLARRPDAIVTDPPYGVGWNGTGDKSGILAATTAFSGTKITGDHKPFDPSAWLDAASVVLWGANHYADKLPTRARWLVWDKRRGLPSNDLADCELAWTNSDMPARLMALRWMGMLKDSERGEPRVHPTQKPVEVMRWCVELASRPGELVLDPYMGSGTTGVACALTGRRFLGVEIDPVYFEVACERILKAHDPAAFQAAAWTRNRMTSPKVQRLV